MSETRRSSDEELGNLWRTSRNAEAIKSLIQTPGGIVGSTTPLEDSGVSIPKTEQVSLLTQASHHGMLAADQGDYQRTTQAISYEAKMQQDNQTLQEFGF
tara:strand:- start:909 stop:1208 length:300 start_codon:yes stop_codon:yes gene_type:complete